MLVYPDARLLESVSDGVFEYTFRMLVYLKAVPK